VVLGFENGTTQVLLILNSSYGEILMRIASLPRRGEDWKASKIRAASTAGKPVCRVLSRRLPRSCGTRSAIEIRIKVRVNALADQRWPRQPPAALDREGIFLRGRDMQTAPDDLSEAVQ